MKTKMNAECDIKIIEGVLAKKHAPSMKWQIDDRHALCWDASMNKVTFYQDNLYMILQFATKKQREYFHEHMDEFFERLGVNE